MIDTPKCNAAPVVPVRAAAAGSRLARAGLALLALTPPLAAAQGVAPVLHLQSKLLPRDSTARPSLDRHAPSATAFALFGFSVAVSGDTLAVGARDTVVGGVSGAGSVYVFVRQSAQWVEQARLPPPQPRPNGYFGCSVALAGDTLVVGEVNGTSSAGSGTGAVHVYVRSGATWTLQAQPAPSELQVFDSYGHALALDGDTLVIGAPGADGPAPLSGTAYVFTRSGASWTQQAELAGLEVQSSDAFGYDVDVQGDSAVVGAESGLVGTNGAAYVFTRSGTSWTQQARLSPADLGPSDFFGAALSLSGDTLAVGAYGQDAAPPANDNLGAAYVFVRNGTSWSRQQKLTVPGGVTGASLGWSIALEGDLLLVGAPSADPPLTANPGIVHVFARRGGIWSVPVELPPADPSPGAQFGSALALVGGRVFVGSRLDNDLGLNSGSAYVFAPLVKGDVDGDLRTDLLLRHDPSGGYAAWHMDGVTRAGPQAAIVPAPPVPSLRVAGVDDFDGDLRQDLVMRDALDGTVEFWLMDDTTRLGVLPLLGASAPPTNWALEATADFDHDRRPDIVWRNVDSSRLVVWLMQGNTATGAVVPLPDQASDANWSIIAARDFDGDGNVDLLWRNAVSGRLVQWLMDASVQRTSGRFVMPPMPVDANWQAVVSGDFGPGPGGVAGTADVVLRNADSGRYVVWYLDLAGQRTSGTFTSPWAPDASPLDWTVAGPR